MASLLTSTGRKLMVVKSRHCSRSSSSPSVLQLAKNVVLDAAVKLLFVVVGSASCRITQLPTNYEEGWKKVEREAYYIITNGLMVYTDGKWCCNVRTVGVQIEWRRWRMRRYGATTFPPYCIVLHATMCLTKCGTAGSRKSIELSEMLYCFYYTAAFQAESCYLCPEDYATTVTTTTTTGVVSSVHRLDCQR
ncbi:unnamed protein product [Taenia asiatica]|uniref:DUF5727 domain-containing protein n=1 Tax=Taenia asiatica TaxID=60517 RepID=A0A0R3WEM3_TAEAS|nr:unnamed protein product [Taenia asiatica]